jgi:DNA-directed RNA polymerase specialized sigma24 family protein
VAADEENELNGDELCDVLDRLYVELNDCAEDLLADALRARPVARETRRLVAEARCGLMDAIAHGEVALTDSALRCYLFETALKPALKRARKEYYERVDGTKGLHLAHRNLAASLIRGTGEDTEEVLNDTDFAFLENARSGVIIGWEDEDIRGAYYRRILRRTAGDVIRKVARQRTHETDLDEEAVAELPAGNFDDWSDPTSSDGIAATLTDHLRLLPPSSVRLIRLLEFGFNKRELASRSSIARSTAWDRIARAQLQAQELLGPIT